MASTTTERLGRNIFLAIAFLVIVLGCHKRQRPVLGSVVAGVSGGSTGVTGGSVTPAIPRIEEVPLIARTELHQMIVEEIHLDRSIPHLVDVASKSHRQPHTRTRTRPAKAESLAVSPTTATDLIKQDCERLVEGQLAFTPLATMRQGKTYVVSARLARGKDTTITVGLQGKLTIENTQVSCMVAITLDSQESHAFKIENIPAGRKDEQFLLSNTYTQWDWHVTPLKSGTLHLLLYVTPMLFVEGVGQGLKHYQQPPRIITVSPNYAFAFGQLVFTHWQVSGTILTAIILPLAIWSFKNWRNKKAQPALPIQ